MLYDEAYRAAGDVTSEVNRRYAEARGYPFVLCRHSLDTTLPIVWSKLKLIQQQMEGCDWVFWVDADALIVGTRPLDPIVEPQAGKDVLFSTDKCGYCAGVMLVRSCHWAWRYLDTAQFVGPTPLAGRNLYDQSTLKALVANFPGVAERCGGMADSIVQNPDSAFHAEALAVHYWGNNCGPEFLLIRKAVALYEAQGYTPEVFRPQLSVRPDLASAETLGP